MLVTLIVAAIAALVWAVLTALSSVGEEAVPHDPTSLELAVMALVTLLVFAWNRQIRQIRREAASMQSEISDDSQFASSISPEVEPAQEHAA